MKRKASHMQTVEQRNDNAGHEDGPLNEKGEEWVRESQRRQDEITRLRDLGVVFQNDLEMFRR